MAHISDVGWQSSGGFDCQLIDVLRAVHDVQLHGGGQSQQHDLSKLNSAWVNPGTLGLHGSSCRHAPAGPLPGAAVYGQVNTIQSRDQCTDARSQSSLFNPRAA